MFFGSELSSSVIRILCQSGKIACSTLRRSIMEEIESSRQAARIRYADQTQNRELASKEGISLEEAMRILHVDKLDPNSVQERFDILQTLNKRSTGGGSLYIQSKIIRAKERIDAEMYKRKDV